jgi:hypothetical protein
VSSVEVGAEELRQYLIRGNGVFLAVVPPHQRVLREEAIKKLLLLVVMMIGCAEPPTTPSAAIVSTFSEQQAGPWTQYCSCQPQPTCEPGTTLLCNRYSNGANLSGYGWECFPSSLLNERGESIATDPAAAQAAP